jgi:hypothetical protein
LTTGVTDTIGEAITTERTPLIDPKSNPSSTSVASSRSPSLSPRHDTPEMRSINRTRLILAISYASFSGIISGMCLLFAKSGVELLLLTLRGQNQFWRWQAWVLVLGLVVFALLQLWYLHKALILADPTLVCPCKSCYAEDRRDVSDAIFITAAFCFYNLSSIVNGLVYFDQFELIPPLHLGLVVLGIFVLLGGVWVVSIQSGSPSDGDTWSDEESAVSDVESEAQYADVEPEDSRGQEQDNRPPIFGRSTSESNVRALSERALSPHSTMSQPIPSMSPPIQRPGLPSRRPGRSSHLRAATASTYSTIAPAPNPVAALGAGFQIGLSPVSPGFGIGPRERGRTASGLHHSYAFADVVDQARRRDSARERRRRTVSEGDVRTRGLALERAELLSSGLPRDSEIEDQARARARARWRWLSTLWR